jgi:hypothetical protein
MSLSIHSSLLVGTFLLVAGSVTGNIDPPLTLYPSSISIDPEGRDGVYYNERDRIHYDDSIKLSNTNFEDVFLLSVKCRAAVNAVSV